MKVTHTKSNVIQYNEYYPFGLQASTSWTRENNSNNFLYNAGNELNQTSGWYETFFRGYDPTLGRFNQVDPLAYASSSHTPYNYGFNNPVFYNDPNGDYPEEVYTDWKNSGGGNGSVDPFFTSDGPENYHNTLAMTGGMSMGIAIDRALHNTANGGSWNNGQAHYFTSGEAMAVANSYHYEKYSYIDYSTENLNGEVWQGATVTTGLRLVQQYDGSGLQQAGLGMDFSLSLLSMGSYAAGVYEDVRAGQIAKYTQGYLKEWQQIRNFNKGYKTARQAKISQQHNQECKYA
jgi:RHS repeat-associated protein